MKTWQMIKELTENPQMKYECTAETTRTHFIASVTDSGILHLDSTNTKKSADGNLWLDAEWEPLPQPVTLAEAMKALELHGKTIEWRTTSGDCKDPVIITLKDWYGKTISPMMLRNGYWSIAD